MVLTNIAFNFAAAAFHDAVKGAGGFALDSCGVTLISAVSGARQCKRNIQPGPLAASPPDSLAAFALELTRLKVYADKRRRWSFQSIKAQQ